MDTSGRCGWNRLGPGRIYRDYLYRVLGFYNLGIRVWNRLGPGGAMDGLGMLQE